ncbi:MAG: NAD(P)-dependent oxidoreductase [Bacteroidota bacterium]
MSNPHIAWIGLGAMGSRMASRLIEAGFSLTVYNRTHERTAPLKDQGARVAVRVEDAVRDADVVISMVRDDAASNAVFADAVLDAMKPGARVVEMSTLTPDYVRRLASRLSPHSVGFVDAPVVGTRPHAEKGLLTVLAGGEAEDIDALGDVFGAFAAATHHIGPVGAGAAMKLAVNTLFAAQAGLLAELLGYLRAEGIASENAVGTLSGLAVTSPAAKLLGGLMVAEKFAPLFPIELVAKDLRYAVAAAVAKGADLPITRATGAQFERAAENGHAGLNITGIAKLYS